MKKEIRDKWCSALRSGEYQQGFGSLRHKIDNRTPTYCCLGVLCDIVNVKFKDMELSSLRHYFFEGSELRISHVATVPENFLGLTQSQIEKLCEMNDSKTKDFKEIADWIEENIPIEDQ